MERLAKVLYLNKTAANLPVLIFAAVKLKLSLPKDTNKKLLGSAAVLSFF